MVIQRIQTLYLLIAAILIATFVFLPCVAIQHLEATTSTVVMPYSIITTQNQATFFDSNYLPAILSAFVAILLIITIFQFKNLNKQQNLCGICILLTFAIIALSVLVSYNTINTLNATNYSFGFSFALPIVSIILILLAQKAIKRDRKLLSSSDRIR